MTKCVILFHATLSSSFAVREGLGTPRFQQLLTAALKPSPTNNSVLSLGAIVGIIGMVLHMQCVRPWIQSTRAHELPTCGVRFRRVCSGDDWNCCGNYYCNEKINTES